MSIQLFESVVKSIEDARDKEGNIVDMQSLIVTEGDQQFSHYFRERETVDIRSIAKPIVCMAIGAAIEKGLNFNGERIDLTTKIWPYLSQYASVEEERNIRKWESVTLLDLFKITLGHDKGLMFSSDVKGRDENTLVDYVVNYPITGRVGHDFVYSNVGTFIVSTLATEFVGKNLDALVDELIFRPLGIEDFTWKKYGKYCAGCTGLSLYSEDLHRIGRLILANGVHDSRQIVPADWIEQMRTPQVPSPTHRYVPDRAFPKWTYGMNLWICEDGNYYCDGTNGQYMIIIPSKEVVITTLGYQKDTAPVSDCLGLPFTHKC